MIEREFNLIDEPWIVAMRFDGTPEKVSLKGIFSRAAEFRCLCGETETQNIAVLRVLLAVLHTVVSRYDENAEELPVESAGEAMARWKNIWLKKELPNAAIQKYLLMYYDRFWLFHPERPFFQVPENDNMVKATRCAADNFNQELSESNSTSTSRFFLQRLGEEKESLSYDEAARWLICLMAYDTAVKPTGSKCWLGTFDVFTADGKNLFEILMLNLIMYPQRCDYSYDEKPSWEPENAAVSQHNLAPMPDNLSALYTFQSRRVILLRKNARVSGFREICGDYLTNANAFIEQMTSWKERKTEEGNFYPVLTQRQRQQWRNLSGILAQTENTPNRPGIVEWLNRLIRKGLISRQNIRLNTVSTEYDGMGYCLKNVVSDNISFSSDILAEKGGEWIPMILNQVSVADALAKQVSYLALGIVKSISDASGDAQKSAALERAYFELDMPFRSWLLSIDTANEQMSDAAERWWKIAQPIIRRLGRDMVNAAGTQALIGRTAIERNGSKETKRIYTAASAYNAFLWNTKNTENLTSVKKTK